MNARITKIWQDLQSSYYFIPGIMAFGAVFLSMLTIKLDQIIDPAFFKTANIFSTNSVEGTRAILSLIAGSMISIAGVTFSLTMVAVTNAVAQYGPRLIGNFMRDRANQFTLGIYTATFIYSLLILRVSHIGDPDKVENGVAEFVPNISVLVAMFLTLACVGVLIFFIHHIPETLNVGNITSNVGHRLRDNIDKLLTKSQGNDHHDVSDEVTSLLVNAETAVHVIAESEGYIQTLDVNTLMGIAEKHDLLADLQYQPGDFVVRGDILADFWTSPDQPQTVDEQAKISKAILNCYALGRQRTVHQNLLYLADELVEILARALSPGVNDPFTAINCIHWYQSALNVMVNSDVPISRRYNKDKKLRIMARAIDFDELLKALCGKSRPYVAGDKMVTLEMLAVLGGLRAKANRADVTAVIDAEIMKLAASARDVLPTEVDRQDVAERVAKITKYLSNPKDIEVGRRTETWIGGSA